MTYKSRCGNQGVNVCNYVRRIQSSPSLRGRVSARGNQLLTERQRIAVLRHCEARSAAAIQLFNTLHVVQQIFVIARGAAPRQSRGKCIGLRLNRQVFRHCEDWQSQSVAIHSYRRQRRLILLDRRSRVQGTLS